MSWFTDLAGRAEELLNKVDQSAAVALKKEDGSSSKPTSRSTTPIRNFQRVAPKEDSSATGTKPPFVASSSVAVTKGHSETTSVKPKSKKEIEELKLFEFLNSSENPLPSTSKIKHGNEVLVTSEREEINSRTDTITTVVDNVVSPMTEESTKEASDVESISLQSASLTAEEQATRTPPLERENRLLQSEVTSLNQDLNQSLKKTQNVEAELRRVKKQLDRCTIQLSGEEKTIREMNDREADLRQSLEAKDSQLAVLRVRLQEVDQELIVTRESIEKLREENSRILDDHSSSSGLHSQAIQTVQERLQQSEEQLEQERVHFRNIQSESIERISRLEEELKTLASNFNEAKSKVQEEKARNAELAAQLRTAKHGYDSSQQELSDYKTKAQRILQSKERLIASLKDNAEKGGDANADAIATSAVELEELRQERDLLKDDLMDAQRQTELVRAELHESESQMQMEVDAAREYAREIEERLKEERSRREDVEQEVVQLKQEIKYHCEDSARQKTTLQSRLNDRDVEIERLRKQLMAKQVNSSGQKELEGRLNALTESLIQKQTMLEALSTEKSSLVFQLERAEQQLKDQKTYSKRNASMAVNVSDDNDSRLRVPVFMTETPFDGEVTRKVKRVYNTIDTFSFRLGVFLRRYPMARILIIIYMVMLHFWVLVVLLTYTPEIHDKDCSVPNGK